jgi:GTP:adenosylcobinamide-phosphate guanylyltransferase
VKAVITAGGRVGAHYAAVAGTSVKALAPVRGATMLERAIDALRGAGATQLAVIGGSEVYEACAAQIDRFVEESRSGGENLLRALRAWPLDGKPLLYATSDLPYVTAAAIEDFIERTSTDSLALALSESVDFCERFPGAPPSGITLAGERVVNGGIFWIPSPAIDALAGVATRFFDARKKPWRMASLVSPLVLVRYTLGRLSIAELEAISHRVLRVPTQAVRGCAPELAFDADTLVEYRYACSHS